MGSGFAVGVLLAAVLCVQAAAEQFNFTLIAGENTLCLGPDMGSMGQNTSDAASCEAACRKSPPCEFWSWCPTSAAGCEVRSLGSTLPPGACLLSHDAKGGQGARQVTLTSGPAVNWTCGHVAPGPGGAPSDAGDATSGSGTPADLITYLPVEYGDCAATCGKAGASALETNTTGAAACRLKVEADTLYGTKLSTSPNCDANGGAGKRGVSADAFDCVCVRDVARVCWEAACAAPAAPAASVPNLCRVSRASDDLSAWVVGYIYSDACLFPARTWSRFGTVDPPITQAAGDGRGEGTDDGHSSRMAHKLQVLCVQ